MVHNHVTTSAATVWRHREAIVYGCIVATSVYLGFCMNPFDEGGHFFRVWIGLAGTGAFGGVVSHLDGWRRHIGCALLPLAAFLPIGSLYFAPQALFPFMFVFAALLSATALSRSSTVGTVVVTLLLIPLGFYLNYGVGQVRAAWALHTLRPDDVRSVEFADAKGNNPVTIQDGVGLEQIVSVLDETLPYSPNHEGIQDPCRVTMLLKDGRKLRFVLGHGNRKNRQAAWIEFGVATYQNARLYSVLVDDLKLVLPVSTRPH